MSTGYGRLKYVAKSGNDAEVTLDICGGRAFADIGWEEYPPTAEDVAELDAVLQQVLKEVTGASAAVLEGNYITNDRMQAAALKAGFFNRN